VKARGVFVTGTDTGVGKTLVSCALLHALRRAGVRVGAMKPIAAGAEERGGPLVNDDTQALLQALGAEPGDAADVTPILMRTPIAPHIAARVEGREIAWPPVRQAHERIRERCDFLVVEGVGGFRVPLGDDWDTVDLAVRFGLPVVMVVGMRLGCLNHALLTAECIARAGLPFAGWVANTIDPHMPCRDDNIATLERRLPGPRLGTLGFMTTPEALAASDALDIRPLLAP
jgi:dethiobiotin synthetase